MIWPPVAAAIQSQLADEFKRLPAGVADRPGFSLRPPGLPAKTRFRLCVGMFSRLQAQMQAGARKLAKLIRQRFL